MKDNKSNKDTTVVTGSAFNNEGKLWATRRNLKIAVILIAIAGIGVLAWFYFNKDAAKLPPLKTRSYSFDDKQAYRFLARHVLVGEGNGNSLEIGIPLTEFLYTDGPTDRIDPRFQTYKKPTDKIQNKGNKVSFGQRIFAADGVVYNQSLIAARIVSPAEKPKFNKYNYFKEELNKLVFKSNIGNPSLLDLDISDAGAFTNKQVNVNAKKYNISVSLPKGVETKGPMRNVVGQIIEISGKNSDYYLAITSIKSVWDKSTKTWLAVQDSIVIDQ